MATDLMLKESLPEITEAIVATYTECKHINQLGHKPLPSRDAVADILNDLTEILYPGFGRRHNLHLGNVEYHVGNLVDGLHDKLTQQIARAMRHEQECQENADSFDFEALAQQKTIDLLRRLPDVRGLLEIDVQYAYLGDPAAKSHHEIIFCYPGLEAVTVYRVAHELLLLGVPLIPRMMSEHAHSKTGIDIHPGARIGPGFFIDHGTGVVIGETAVIGANVRLYQAVTLGARRFAADADGQLERGGARHPIVEDDVVIYAGATILGRVTIGRGTAIGGNVWLTRSVPPGSQVTQAQTREGGRDEAFSSGSGI